MMTTISSGFLDFAEHNQLALHEVHKGDKNPIGDEWQNRHTSDPTVWPVWIASGNNIGLHPGASRLAVMDIEAGKQEIAKAWFQELTGFALPAAHVATPSGGTHIWFRLNDATGLKSLRMKETGWGDLLVGNANAMCPPSIFTNPKKQPGKKAGPYEWLGNEMLCDGDILRPAWRKRDEHLERVGTAREAPRDFRPAEGLHADRVLKQACADILKLELGGVNNGIFDIALRVGRYVGNGELGYDVAHDELKAACEDAGWDDSANNLKAIHNGLKDGIKYPAMTVDDMFGAAVAEIAAKAGATLSTPFTLFDDCATSAPKVWLHKGVMALGENSTWFGEPGSLKSALITDIAVHAAAGIDWRGHRIKTCCGVVYFAFERSGQAKRRLAAYKMRDDLHGLPIAVVPKLVDLLNPQCVDLIVSIVERAAKAFGVPVGLIVLDTYNKGIAAGGGDENAAKDQNQAAAHLRLIHERLNVHIAGIGHTGKDTTRGERGSNAREGDVDLAVQITGDAVKTATVTKANDQEEGELVSFAGQVVHLGRDEDGDPVTAFILSKTPAVKEAKARKKLTDRETNAMRALENVIRENGSGGRASADAWRERLHREGVIKDDDANPRATYSRIHDGLARKGCIHALDGMIAVRPARALTPLVNLFPPPTELGPVAV
ncbi:MAG: AAA family ATPase [Rhizobiales bacterium]|nr:AAA family ATPase [Hyphomicrobiales bacterium]